MPPPSQSGPLRWLQWQPQRAVGVLALVLGLVLCALVVNNLQRDYEQQVQAASAKTDSLVRLLEEHVRQSMRRIELALSLAAQEVQVQYRARGQIDASTAGYLRRYVPEDGLINSFVVLSPAGKVLASTLTDAVADMPLLNDRDFFLAFQKPAPAAGSTEAPGAVFIGQPVKSRLSGQWIIPVSMHIDGPSGGLLVGAVDPEYFQHLYRSIDTGSQGFVTMLTRQGWAIARWPFSAEVAQHNWRDSLLFTEDIPRAPVGAVQRKNGVNGVDTMFSYRALSEYPLVVTVGVAREEVLRAWRERAWYQGTGLLLVLLFLGGATLLLIAQLRRRIQAESALKLAEISVLKSSLPTLWVGADARILRVNQAACELHGYPEEVLLTMTIPDLNPAMPMDHWKGHWERLRQAKNMRFETVHRTGQGTDVPVEVELNFIEFDGQEYNFSFMRDLTVRKQTESEIQRIASLMRSAMDAVDEAFVLFDTEDRLVYCNDKYVQLYPELRDVVVPGAKFEDMIRAGAERGMYVEAAGREEEWIAERLHAHREGNETRIQKRDDGRVLRVIDRRTAEGNIAGIRVDITEMVKVAEEAQEASRYKSQFLANMSHEIRTPMNAILGLLTLLQHTDLSATQRDYAAKTEGAAQSLLYLLNDILDFSKVEAGKMEMELQPFRLDRMLRDLAVILSSTMEGRAIEVLFDIDPNVPEVVVADAMRLHQVLVNLGGNAIKFTAQGQVVLKLRRLEPPADQAESLSLLEFSVQDSGIGIAPEQQEHIFSGFSQAEASTTRRFGGTGLGLAICRRLVALMGGNLQVQSRLGVGSTFSFVLPLPLPTAEQLAEGALHETPNSAEPTDAPVVPKRLLVVDDNPVAREVLSAMAGAWSWTTQVASNGVQALELIRKQQTPGSFPFDVLCVDWQMPGMDGWETVRRIRQLSLGLAVQPRIVMLSADGQDRLERRTLDEQALIDGFLFKPVIPSALRDAALGRNRSDFARLAQRSSHRPLAGLRILVVEDNLINQQVAEELLNAEGALVSLAANGQLGVDAVAASQPPFDAVLMDIQMPVLDGFGATRKIREELGQQTLPIVAMTANAMASDRQACLAAGMNEHVGKPFDMQHLVEVLLRATGREAQSSQSASLAPQRTTTMFSHPYLELEPALERIAGLTSLYADIAKEFLQSLDAVEQDFRQAALAADMDRLVAQMHTLKGTAATLGAEKLSKHVAGLELRFRRATPELAPLDVWPVLGDMVQHTRVALLQALASMQEAGDAAQRPSAPANGPAERERAKAFLFQLLGLVRASDLAALEHFAKRGDALDALPTGHVEALQLALKNLDLSGVRQLCESYMEALE